MSSPGRGEAAVAGKQDGNHKCHVCKRIWEFLDAEHRRGGGVGLGLVEEVLLDSDCQKHVGLIKWLCRDEVPTGWQPFDELTLFFDSGENGYYLYNIRGPGQDSMPTGKFNILREGSTKAPQRVRLTDPSWIDRGVFRRWKDLCDHNHGQTCRALPWKASGQVTVRPMWVIDVLDRCLVRTPTEGAYVTLSYVWGTKPFFVSLRENLLFNQERNALTAENKKLEPGISRTVLDAMDVVRSLGERYLWVDALCIVQDDAAQKQAEIGNMAEIYAHASLTIIAAQSLDATSGMRGLSSCRHAGQDPFRINENTQAVRLLEGDPDYSVWAGRAWTYQEYISSRRSLIFAGESVHWHCGLASWFEDRVESLPTNTRLLYPALAQEILGKTIPQPQLIFSTLLSFNVRQLTFPEDALFAFAGMAAVLSRSFRGGFISGLPEVFFDLALLWQPWEFNEFRVCRAPGACLPSWSWASFRGTTRPWNWEIAAKFVKSGRAQRDLKALEDVSPLVQWSCHQVDDGIDVPIRHEWLNSRDEYLAEGGGYCSLVDGWARHELQQGQESPAAESSSKTSHGQVEPERPSTGYYYTHEAEPESEFWWPVPLPGKGDWPKLQQNIHFISCRTRRAWLQGHEALKINTSAHTAIISLHNGGGAWAGALEVMGIDVKEVLGSDAEHDGSTTGSEEVKEDGDDEEDEDYDDDDEDEEDEYEDEDVDDHIIDIEDAEALPENIRVLASQNFELVEVARGTITEHAQFWNTRLHQELAGSEVYYVMWIEWEGDVAYRRGLGRVNKSAWEALNREWIDLVLG